MTAKVDESKDKYISLEEACRLLETTDEEVHELVRVGKLNAYKIGDRYLRLRKDQVSEIKAKWRINRELFPANGRAAHVLVADRPGPGDRLRDFLYFNDFYIVCSVFIAALLTLILSSR